MSRKSWVDTWLDREVIYCMPGLKGHTRSKLRVLLVETIEECARRCASHHSVEGIAQRCERDILALLESGDEGVAP